MESYIKEFVALAISLSLLAIAAGLYTFVRINLFSAYLRKNHIERWQELTTMETRAGTFQPIYNFINFWRYVNSKLDNDEKTILRNKVSIRKGMRYFAIFVLASFLSFIVTGILISKVQ